MEDKSINVGKVAMTMGGNYDPSKAYDKLVCVHYNYRSWVSKKPVSEGIVPSEANSAFWQMIADRGERGPEGQSYVDREMVPIVDDLTTGGSANVLSAEQGKVIKQELTELESDAQKLYSTDNIITSLSQFELGNVSDVDGTLIDHPNRRRTDLITLPLDNDGLPYELKAHNSSNVELRAVWYDDNKTFIGGTYHLIPPTNARYVRFVATPNPDKTFTDSLLLTMQLYIYAQILTNIQLRRNIVDLRNEVFGKLPLEYGSILSNGTLVDSSSRIRTKELIKNFIVETHDGFLVYEVYTFDKATNRKISAVDVSTTKYESNFDEVNSYIKVVFRATDNSDIADIRKVIKAYNSSAVISSARAIRAMNDNLNEGVIYENKGINGTENTSRIISDYIAIPHNSTYRVTIPQGYSMEYLLYKEIGTLYYESTYFENSAIIANGECNYLRLYIRKIDDKTIYPEDGVRFKVVTGGAKKYSIRLAQWNMGYMNNGMSPSGMIDSEMIHRIPEVRNILTKLNADILFVNENSVRVNQGNDGASILQTYETFMQQFYPYRFVGGEAMAIYSKYPLACKELSLSVGAQRKYIKADLSIGNALISMLLIHSSPYSADDRLSENVEFVSAMKDYNLAIIAGDFNTGNNRESAELEDAQLAPFINGGYTLGNRGYWGNKVTYPSTEQVLDNIIAKGVNIDNYEVLDNASVSDHLPTYAELSVVA